MLFKLDFSLPLSFQILVGRQKYPEEERMGVAQKSDRLNIFSNLYMSWVLDPLRSQWRNLSCFPLAWYRLELTGGSWKCYPDQHSLPYAQGGHVYPVDKAIFEEETETPTY